MAALRYSLRHYRHFTASATTSPVTKQVLTTSDVKEKFRLETDADKAIELYKDLSSSADISPFASRFALDSIAKRLAQSRRFDDIENLIESHKKDPQITDERFFFGLIRAYGVAHMAGHALRLFDQMEELGTPRSVLSFNALLTAYNLSKKYKQVANLFDEIPKKHGISPDKVSYNILLKSHCARKRNSSVDAALLVLNKMEEENIEMSSITYTIITHALYTHRRVEEAESKWNEMLKKGCKPDVSIYNVRIVHARRGNPDVVLAMIEEMKKVGVQPDTMTYNHLFTCYFRNNMMEEAVKVYESFGEKGLFRNAATFEIYVSHLCAEKNFAKAYEVLKEGSKENKLPHFGIFKSLYRGLVKNSMTMEAEELLTIMKKKFSTKVMESLKKLKVVIDKEEEGEQEEKFDLSKDEESPEEETAAPSA